MTLDSACIPHETVLRWLSSFFSTRRTSKKTQGRREVINSTSMVPRPIECDSESTSSIESKEVIYVKRRRIQAALTVASRGQYLLVNDFPVPKIHKPDEILIRNQAVALNPIDWKSVDYNFCLPQFPWITGRECAGVVEDVGAGVSMFKRGDRVWTSTYYKDIRAGCFQEYLVVPAHTVCPIPDTRSFEEAACLGVGALTAAITLWHWLEIPMPSEMASLLPGHTPARKARDGTPDEFALVWGGGSITGQFAVQLLNMANFKTIVVASKKSAPLLTARGATHVVIRDGKSNDTILGEIHNLGQDKITTALDLVGPKTVPLCLESLSSSLPAILAPLALMKPDQPIPNNVSVASIEMKRFVLDETFAIYAQELNNLVLRDKLTFPKLEILHGGLQQVELGLNRLKSGEINGSKLIVSLHQDRALDGNQ